MLRRCFLAFLALLAAPLALADDALWQRLQSGGYVLLIRHAATIPGIGDPPGFKLAACATQRNLSEQGKRDAAAIGAAFRERGIPLGAVLSSRWCRCLDTARLAFGRVEEAPMLDSMFQDSEAAGRAKVREVLARTSAWRQAGSKDNLVLVTHDVNIRALVSEFVAQGEIVVAQPVDGRLQVVGRLPLSTVVQRRVP
ncbi:histidine phosphatase family protein [Massilia sp. G4R7]|uniref:Histidine phosphatase family protein n=1 Tax=Massilia phyllostachyos TaxID=2898585 RepID=A0ABS8Q8G8_9BURK|nr:histidine phosphatase family protein [Massilia phyllostachyos]MCD2517833.1 histidine phosphatase family protein [Massilia phyllostachyos]